MKHGYRAATVEGIPDFAACKSCHYDDRKGGHEDWQWMVDDPLSWATNVKGDAEKALYAYTANVMNDTHMSHAMEFPYPMSMYNCASCHDGKLDRILADENFTATTCKSCHPVQGIDAWPSTVGDVEEGTYAQDERAPPLEYLWAEGGVDTLHAALDLDANPEACQNCHVANAPALQASVFSEYHTGWDPRIHQADGQKYANLYTASVDSVTIDGNLMTVAFSSNTPDIVPELTVSFYGYQTKDMLVSSHTRDANAVRMEYVPESSGGNANALFTEAAGSGPGAWTVTLDMAAYAPVNTDSIPDLILAGTVSKAEVAVAPELEVGGIAVALDAVSETVNLGSGAFVDNYFKGDNAIVSEEKCNVCHDQLAATFHSGSGRGGSIVVCRTCHVTTNGGSHLEMQSRSIDSYIHGVHSFQNFDTDDTFESYDPVFSARYQQHISHVFPNFTINNCEACHVTVDADTAVTYNVPNQANSMPGLLSPSYMLNTWYGIDADGLPFEDPAGRSIGTVPEVVTGPAVRACGGCHRARLINQDQAGELASFYGHGETFGTVVVNDSNPAEEDLPADQVLYGVIDKIMSLFQ
jgi:OmcA/MtrC family decaheme c-type cytochrome